MSAQVIRFPSDRESRRAFALVGAESAMVIILPVIRIERYGEPELRKVMRRHRRGAKRIKETAT